MEVDLEEVTWQKLIDQDRSIIGIFADWLEDRGDIRAEGYRMLWILGVGPRQFKDLPFHSQLEGMWWIFSQKLNIYKKDESYSINHDWWQIFSNMYEPKSYLELHKAPKTREECDNAVAIAWSKLSYSQKDEVLNNMEIII